MVKSIFTALLAIGLIFGVSGCGSNGSSDDITGSATDGVNTGLSEKGQNLPKEFEAGKFGVIELTPDYKVPEEALFLDVRNPSEVKAWHAKGSQDGAIYEFRRPDYSEKRVNPDFVNEVLSLPEVNGDRSRYIVLICNSSSRTSRAVEWLATPKDQKWREYDGGGFTRIYHIKGGMEEWAKLNLPIEGDDSN